MKKRINIKVSGKVQGVFFRANTTEQARKLSISGWVANMPDGSVYIEAEGEESQMDLFLDWLRKGPQLSRVDELEQSAGQVENFEGFEIRYI